MAKTPVGQVICCAGPMNQAGAGQPKVRATDPHRTCAANNLTALRLSRACIFNKKNNIAVVTFAIAIGDDISDYHL